MLSCDLPIVAQIEGNCMGAGVEIACCCDIRLASDDARFGAPIARLGFPMAPREAALVARVAGESTARAMLLAAQVFEAPMLLQRGFLQQVFTGAALVAEVASLSQRMSALAPQAARMNKATFRALAEQGAAALPALVQTAYAYADTPEHREGVSAFMQKRPARFS
jgi:enoyl-CoA hydratase/carnithine racemase